MRKNLFLANSLFVALFFGLDPAQASPKNYSSLDYYCYMVQQDGEVRDLELVCNPNALQEAAERAERAEATREAYNSAVNRGDPLFCSFLTENTSVSENPNTSDYIISVPTVCTAIQDTEGVSVWMQLRVDGTRILGETTESVSLLLSGDKFIFDAEFFGEFAPSRGNVSILYRVR